jgi:hypothetical protein
LSTQLGECWSAVDVGKPIEVVSTSNGELERRRRRALIATVAIRTRGHRRLASVATVGRYIYGTTWSPLVRDRRCGGVVLSAAA